NRLIDAEKAYSKAISNMPKGSPCVKRIRNGSYLYLERREGKKVIFEYIGSIESGKAKNVLVQIEKRKRFEKLLKEASATLHDIRKVLRRKI
ncbi:MAG: hypothetical protein ACM31E_12445, partial [Fibrobacterota bacterium]|nr:hypothetical protein [Chitinispirillaceae bacterium]